MRGVSTLTAGRLRRSCLGRHSGRSTESRQGQVGRPGTKPPPGCAMSTPCQRIRLSSRARAATSARWGRRACPGRG